MCVESTTCGDLALRRFHLMVCHGGRTSQPSTCSETSKYSREVSTSAKSISSSPHPCHTSTERSGGSEGHGEGCGVADGEGVVIEDGVMRRI